MYCKNIDKKFFICNEYYLASNGLPRIFTIKTVLLLIRSIKPYITFKVAGVK